MTFIPNQTLMDKEIANLQAKQPGGGFLTPDDIKLIVSERKWAEAPRFGAFVKTNGFLFWEAVERRLQIRESLGRT